MYILRGASEVVTAKPTLKPLSGEAMGIVDRRANTDVLIEGDKIVKVSKNIEAPGAEIIDVTGKVIVPGFVDPHTHLVWAGSREHELEWKLEGKTYQDILANGGGILRTVKETRSVDEEELQSQTLKRFKKAMSHGTTTIEIKSGYGLEEETELKQLRVANWLKSFNLADIVVTFMGAHAFPEDLNKYEYVEEVIRMLPLVKDLAEYCDVFCEEGAFTIDESREILEAAKSLGFKLKIHADEFGDTGGGRLGADLGVVTADHLAGSSLETIKMLSRSGAIGVLLPGTPFALLSDHYSPARKMIANNLPIALATDCNPNCYTESMQLVQQLAVFRMGMTPAEALVSSTINAAFAIGKTDRGVISEGWRADLLVCDVPDYRHLTYHFGINHVEKVIIGGKVFNG
ncbi:MAG: imidazolonepropionase [Candidatus Thermoplasmatota archaeon]|nr:imidazolonepropionase [Candidatus Thermoplasmatota archaeon]MEC7698001.1 imidazolonepropionase [Candidatus Thermoplasmatota archaeon]MEC8217047.1 imidazolonepropionase [Candidatus Thermoplasmatota archaeon]